MGTTWNQTAHAGQFNPRVGMARGLPRAVNFLALARELSADPQLHGALQVSGTALLGVATDGVPLMIRLASPDVTHVLISGSKGSGKTEIARTILASLALYQKPREIQFVVCASDARAFECVGRVPHLRGEIATTTEGALQHLRWLENELERRENENGTRPRLVVVMDDYAEFLRHGGREVQVHVARLAQRGRRVGISLLVCTPQANGADLDAGLRANFPVRLIGKNSNSHDGAEKLAGRGDFILTAGGERVRFQAARLAPEDVPTLQFQVRANHSHKPVPDARLHSLVKRLRRVK